MFANPRRSRHRHSALWLAAGLIAGIVAGVAFADRTRIGRALATDEPEMGDEGESTDADESEDREEEDYDDGADESADGHLDERVLAAFEQDPVLAARAIEIEEPEPGSIRLSGRVLAEREVAHAVTIARGTPGVQRVEHRLRLRRPARESSGTGADE